MRLKATILACAIASALPLAAQAQSAKDSVVAQLQAQGYTHIAVSQTLLGRTRILARAEDGRREIILNPRTGEILRDFWETADSSGPTIVQQGGHSGSGSNSGSGSSNSGSGSGNSGSGSSGSGSSGSGNSGSSGSGSGGGDDGDHGGHHGGDDGGEDSGDDD